MASDRLLGRGCPQRQPAVPFGDHQQADLLENWLEQVLKDYGDRVLPLDGDAAQLWGRLRVPDPHHAIDKQIAAIALLNDLTVVTRNTADFAGTGVRLLNAFRSLQGLDTIPITPRRA